MLGKEQPDFSDELFADEPKEKSRVQKAYENYISENSMQIDKIRESVKEKVNKDISPEDIAKDKAKVGDPEGAVVALELTGLPFAKKAEILLEALKKELEGLRTYVNNAEKSGFDVTGELKPERERIQKYKALVSALENK
jgi:hypothetical protein